MLSDTFCSNHRRNDHRPRVVLGLCITAGPPTLDLRERSLDHRKGHITGVTASPHHSYPSGLWAAN